MELRIPMNFGKRSIGLLITILPVFFLGLSSCKSRNPDDALTGPPHIYPSGWMDGELTGYRLYFDRNGNLKESAVVQRVCTVRDPGAGHCEDTIKYHHNIFAANNKQSLNWTLNFISNHRALWEIRLDFPGDAVVKKEIPVHHQDVTLEGHMPVPGDAKKLLPVSVRFIALPGTRGLIQEEEVYQNLGMVVGSVRTIWMQGAEHDRL